MPAKIYKISLTKDEKRTLIDVLNKEEQKIQKWKRAQALLLAHENYSDEAIAERTGMSRRGLEQLRHRFAEEGFKNTLEGKGKGHRPRSLQGKDEARLISLAYGPKPEGKTRWSLRLLAEKWAALTGTDVKTVSRETIRRILKRQQTPVIPKAPNQ
jgi:transposase